MKSRLLIFSLMVTLCFGEDVLHKTAVLILPPQIECKSGDSRYMSGEIGFRWDGADPLKMDVWSRGKPSKANQLLGDIEVFDEDGKKLERQFFVSMPPMSDGEMVIKSGEYKQLGIFVWNGAATFPHPGNYYAIATFESAWTGKTNVIFTTGKRWFKVVEALPKRSDL